MICVSLQLTTAKICPSSCTNPAPCVAPKFAPVRITGIPASAFAGETPVISGTAALTVKFNGLLDPNPLLACTVAGPGVVELGATKHTCELLHSDGASTEPFRLTVPAALPKPVPWTHCVPPRTSTSHCTETTCGTPAINRPPEVVKPCTVTSSE